MKLIILWDKILFQCLQPVWIKDELSMKNWGNFLISVVTKIYYEFTTVKNVFTRIWQSLQNCFFETLNF